MKIAVNLFNLDNIKTYLEHTNVDIFIIGNDTYANRLSHSFSEEEIKEACEQIKSFKKEIYIQMNLIVHNQDLETIKNFFETLKPLNVDGIIFGDLAIYQIAKENHMESLLIYNPETLNTNYYDPYFWENKGIKGLTISKEITLEDIKQITQNSAIEISLIGHGHLNMFHSRRPLIENYFKYNKEEYEKYLENRNLHLIEEIRNESYPVFQDNHGTHIFRDKIMESYQEINELNKHLDVFIIDGIFKDETYIKETLKNYNELLTNFNEDHAKALSEQYKETHDSGFLYKKTVYDKY